MPRVRVRGLWLGVLIWLLSVPQPAVAGTGGLVVDDNVGRTTVVIGLVVLTVAVIAARFIGYFASWSHTRLRRR